MELKINREMLSVTESIFDGIQEQSVELDYILPDYCPDIFKLVKCFISPSILSYSINADTLSYELQADIRIIYCPENSSSMQCVSQKMTFSKSLQLQTPAEKPMVSLKAKADHINCRAANKRRIDMRGAVSVKIRITGERTQEVICDIFGMNSQLRKVPVELVSGRISTLRTLSVSEDYELSRTAQPALSVIRYSAVPEVTDKKIIANKLVVKGEARISVLYSGEKEPETAGFSVPFSQIVDMEGLDEGFACTVKAEVISCDITPCGNENGDQRILRCELRIALDCAGIRTVPAELVTDVYSTTYPCEYASAVLKLRQPPTEISEVMQERLEISGSDGSLSRVYDVWCTPKNINAAADEKEQCLVVSGMIEYCVLAQTENGMPAAVEKAEAFERRIPISGICGSAAADIDVIVSDCAYTISSSDSISLKADMKICGTVCLSSSCEAVTEVSFDESVKKVRDGDYALKLYYGVEGEDIWEIAKRCSTSVAAIMEENELETQRLAVSGMLLIPIV